MKKYKRQVNNKIRGAFGMIDESERTIAINKKRHKNKQALKKIPKKDRPMINTIVHEEAHAAHPGMTERGVRKFARRKVSKISRKEKNKLYQRYQ